MLHLINNFFDYNNLNSFQPARRILLPATYALLLLMICGGDPHYNLRAEQMGGENLRNVVINKTRLADAKVNAFEQKFRVRIPDGNYWYDRVSGAWGVEGGPTAGFILPGLNLGGPLRADASKGRTGVFVNGRELHRFDVLALQKITPVYRGRFWVDAQGNGGYEGGPAFFNLIQLARNSGLLRGGARRSILSGMYDSGIGRVLGNGDFYISGDSSITH